MSSCARIWEPVQGAGQSWGGARISAGVATVPSMKTTSSQHWRQPVGVMSRSVIAWKWTRKRSLAWVDFELMMAYCRSLL